MQHRRGGLRTCPYSVSVPVSLWNEDLGLGLGMPPEQAGPESYQLSVKASWAAVAWAYPLALG